MTCDRSSVLEDMLARPAGVFNTSWRSGDSYPCRSFSFMSGLFPQHATCTKISRLKSKGMGRAEYGEQHPKSSLQLTATSLNPVSARHFEHDACKFGSTLCLRATAAREWISAAMAFRNLGKNTCSLHTWVHSSAQEGHVNLCKGSGISGAMCISIHK